MRPSGERTSRFVSTSALRSETGSLLIFERAFVISFSVHVRGLPRQTTTSFSSFSLRVVLRGQRCTRLSCRNPAKRGIALTRS